MTMSDPIGDMLARVRNAHMRGHGSLSMPFSGLKSNILSVFEEEGYIRGVSSFEEDGKKFLKVELKYYEGKPAIVEMKRISRPGRRVYVKVSGFPSVYNGLGISVVSTPKGVMADYKARSENVGGEILCSVF